MSLGAFLTAKYDEDSSRIPNDHPLIQIFVALITAAGAWTLLSFYIIIGRPTLSGISKAV
jgi:hypothetical protein